jgi:hypothetical protein
MVVRKNMVVISSFYNEEYMLPWWLKHHKDMFDHGVLFDYYSTDRSRCIIREICPTWEIRNTKNTNWNFKNNDKEFMAAEREFEGFKIVLTTTEFLVGNMPELPEYPVCYEIPIFRMVDNEPKVNPTHNKPLLEQKHYGYPDTGNRHRFLHNFKDGWYYVGRHKTKHVTETCSLTVAKYEFSPWTRQFVKRRLSMKDMIDPKDVKRNLGLHHTYNKKQLRRQYKKALGRDDNRDFVLHRRLAR